ncbi:MAG: DUF4177 domain-containing protein [Runella sp.]
MERFEYKILNISREHLKQKGFQAELIERLNALGSDGWELVATEGLNDTSMFTQISKTTDLIFIFKRRV